MATALVQGLDGRTVLGRVWGTAGLCRYDIPLSDKKMNGYTLKGCGQMEVWKYEMKNGGNEHSAASQLT